MASSLGMAGVHRTPHRIAPGLGFHDGGGFYYCLGLSARSALFHNELNESETADNTK